MLEWAHVLNTYDNIISGKLETSTLRTNLTEPFVMP